MSERSERSTPVQISKSRGYEGGPNFCRNCGTPLDADHNCINCNHSGNRSMASKTSPRGQSHLFLYDALKKRIENSRKVNAATIAVLIIIFD